MAASLGLASAYLKSFDVAPTHAALSGTVSGNPRTGGVGETFVADFDSAAEVDVFIGDLGPVNYSFDVEIKDSADVVVAHSYGVVAPKGHTWVPFPMTPVVDPWTGPKKIVRGKGYRVVVTRPEGGQINWYKDTTNKYAFGHMEGGGDTTSTANDDLCMKLFGKARVGDEFATQSNVAWKDSAGSLYDTFPYTSPAAWDACIDRESAAGVKCDKIGYGFWGIVQPQQSEFKWYWLDQLMMSYATHRIRPIMSFSGAARWANCGRSNGGQPSRGAIPSGLFEPVIVYNPSPPHVNPDNYCAKYIYEFVRRYGPVGHTANIVDTLSGIFWRAYSGYDELPIRLFEGFDEAPYWALYPGRHDSLISDPAGYWRLNAYPLSNDSVVDPTYRQMIYDSIQYYGDEGGRKASFAAAYARLVIVLDSAVKLAYEPSVSGDPPRCQSVAFIDDFGMYGINNWLTRLKAYGADTCFDVASCWGYAMVGDPEGHARVLDTVRTWLPDAGYAPRPYIFPEFGCTWEIHHPTDLQRAYHLSKAYPVLQAANATPGYSALQGAWFTFSQQNMGGGWPIIRDSANDWQFLAPAYAYRQWSNLAKGADFEGGTILGDSIFLYQFEDSLKKKFWITWAAVSGQVPSTIGIPARSDTIDSMPTAIDSLDHQDSQTCAVSGWLSATSDTVPLIVIERPNTSRPDMTVDSVWCEPTDDPSQGGPVVICARIRNHGTDSTPVAPSGPALCTRVRYYIEGQLVSQTDYLRSIHAESTVVIPASDTFAFGVPFPQLVKVTVNEETVYVEVGMNDNAGYRRYVSTQGEGGQSGGGSGLPKTLALNQPFPNPARAALKVSYALPRQTKVSVKLYDISGKLVRTLAMGEQAPGYYDATWDRKDAEGRSVSRGVYFCTLAAENRRFCRKVILTE